MLGSLPIQANNVPPTNTVVTEQTIQEIPVVPEQTLEIIKLKVKRIDISKMALPKKLNTLPKIKLKTPQRASIAGNGYDYGYCTWYAKSKLAWVPNNWGNAHSWAYNARISGYTVSKTPIVNAVAQNSIAPLGHVAVVTAVNKNSVTISEANYIGWNKISSRTVPKSEFVYIY